MTTRRNALDQGIDIAGSLTKTDSLTPADENTGLGELVAGQTGSAANITAFSVNEMTLTGLSGLTAQSIGRTLRVSGANTAGNNGSFPITQVISSSSAKVYNPSGAAPDANNGAISWEEREYYTLQTDLNFSRTDRKNIKGTANYYDAVPTYQRPTAVGTNVPANLTNIAGKTTDAKAVVVSKEYLGQTATAATGFLTLTDAGNLKHATSTDRTGVPINDGADAGVDEATYVEIIDPTTEAALEVLSGGNAGKRIFGRTRAGSATSPNSVEVEFRAVAKGANLSTSVAYTWEAGQPTTVNLSIGFRQRLDNLDETALRRNLASGIVGDAGTHQDIVDIRTTLGVADNATSFAGTLTNTGNFFPFVNLPDATPSAVEIFNTLNAQIGNRSYSGGILTNGQTITASLQALSSAIAAANFVRLIERLTSNNPAGTPRTLPSGQTYTIDPTFNGQNLTLFWRGALRDPGPASGGNDYEETSTSSFTPYQLIKANSHINYYIYA